MSLYRLRSGPRDRSASLGVRVLAQCTLARSQGLRKSEDTFVSAHGGPFWMKSGHITSSFSEKIQKTVERGNKLADHVLLCIRILPAFGPHCEADWLKAAMIIATACRKAISPSKFLRGNQPRALAWKFV